MSSYELDWKIKVIKIIIRTNNKKKHAGTAESRYRVHAFREEHTHEAPTKGNAMLQNSGGTNEPMNTRVKNNFSHLLESAVHVADAPHVLEPHEARLALVLGYLVRLLPERRSSTPSRHPRTPVAQARRNAISNAVRRSSLTRLVVVVVVVVVKKTQ